MQKRIEGYDLIRTTAILVVFIGHTLGNKITNEAGLLALRSLSPGLTMSLLGFISAALLSGKKYDFGVFLIKRFTRIYISLGLCLFFVLSIHAWLGKNVINQHVILHLMGLSAFFGIFLVENKATIGNGLWFITAINLMYLMFPLLERLFKHARGFLHLVSIVVLCTVLNFVMYGMASTWNVVISFAVGVYLGVNDKNSRLNITGIIRPLLGSIGLLFLVALATAGVLPYAVRELLFAFYPLMFVPLFFAVSERISKPLAAASGFFAGLSFEFYILHFYFITNFLPKWFEDFFPLSISLSMQVLASFIITLGAAYVMSQAASWLRKMAVGYLLESRH